MSETVATPETSASDERVLRLLGLRSRVRDMTDEELAARLKELEPLSDDAAMTAGRSMTDAHQAGQRAAASGSAVDMAIAAAARAQETALQLDLRILLEEDNMIRAELEHRGARADGQAVTVSPPSRARLLAAPAWRLVTTVLGWVLVFFLVGVGYVKAAAPFVSEQEMREAVRLFLGFTLLGVVADLRGWFPVILRFGTRTR